MSAASSVGVLMLALGLAASAATPQSDGAAPVFDRPVSALELRNEILARPAAELATTTQISGKFVQRRFLSELPRPLVSRGEFTLDRDEGIVWRTWEPFPSEFLLTPDGMTLRDGSTETHVSKAERPALAAALEMFVALFALDIERLAASFELYGIDAGDRWQVGLKPRSGGLAQVFERAVITGEQHVERIELESAGGDRTEIELSDVVVRATGPAAAEAARR